MFGALWRRSRGASDSVRDSGGTIFTPTMYQQTLHTYTWQLIEIIVCVVKKCALAIKKMKRTDISFLPINFSNKGPRDHVMIRQELWLVQFLNGFTDRNQLLHQIDILTTQIWLKQSTVANKLSLIDIMMGYVWGKKGKH